MNKLIRGKRICYKNNYEQIKFSYIGNDQWGNNMLLS